MTRLHRLRLWICRRLDIDGIVLEIERHIHMTVAENNVLKDEIKRLRAERMA